MKKSKKERKSKNRIDMKREKRVRENERRKQELISKREGEKTCSSE